MLVIPAQYLRPVSLTLATSPTQPNSAASNGKTLHLFNRPLSVRFADKLNETAIFPSWDLDLHRNSTVSHGSEFYLTIKPNIVDVTKRREERPQRVLRNKRRQTTNEHRGVVWV